MFFICNVILALLAKSSASSSVSFSSCPSLSKIKAATLDDEDVYAPSIDVPIKNDAFLTEEEQELSTENDLLNDRKREVFLNDNRKREVTDLVAKYDEVVKEEGSSLYLKRQEREDDKEAEEEIEVAAGAEDVKTEELNRKIEEFIRKTKEEIRMEAQRQLIEA